MRLAWVIGAAALFVLMVIPAIEARPVAKIDLSVSPKSLRLHAGGSANVTVTAKGDLQCDPSPPVGPKNQPPVDEGVTFFTGARNTWQNESGTYVIWRFEPELGPMDAIDFPWDADVGSPDHYTMNWSTQFKAISEFWPPGGAEGTVGWNFVLHGSNPGRCTADGYDVPDTEETMSITVEPPVAVVGATSGTHSPAWELAPALAALGAAVVLSRRR